MKNQAFALALLLCSAGAFAQTHTLFGVNGSVFSVTTDGQTVEAISPLVDPVGGLTFFGGKLYGVTKSGGENGYGSIYRANIDGTGLEVTYDFTESQGSPLAGLVVVGDYLWGTTATGGGYGDGTIFYTPGSSYINVGHNFTSAENGAAVAGPLVESGGLLWGTTSLGGTNGLGTIFSSNPALSGYHVLIHTFSTLQGANPKGRLLPYNGFLWGVAENGGANGLGTIFKIDLSDNTFTNVHDLATADGTNPIGGLIESGGLLIGMAQNGGANGFGTIFTIDPADGDAFANTIDLDETTGANPRGALTAFDGVLYGLTSSEGANGTGTYFSLTADGATLEVLHDFDETTGGSPINATLIPVNQAPAMLEPVVLEFTEDIAPEPVDLAPFFDDPESPGSELTFTLQNALPDFIYSISFDGSAMTVELNENLFGEFTVLVDVADAEGATGGAEIVINVSPVAETVEISNASTDYLTENTDGLLAYRSYWDGAEVTHIKVTGINNGSLFDLNGDEIQDGDFVLFEDSPLAFKFLPTAVGEIHFNIQGATGDNDDYLGGDVAQATVYVDKASPVIDWPNPPDIFIGEPVTEEQLNASTTVPGTFSYSPQLGAVMPYGQFWSIDLTFTPDDQEHYYTVYEGRSVSVYANAILLGLGGTDGGNIFTYTRGESTLEQVASVPTTGTNGHNPNGELLSIDHKHYGTMQAGGANGHGTIYYMNANGTGLTKIHDFDGTNGSKPVRGLFYDYNTELLWGVTYEGGANNFGTIFSIEPSGENFVKRHDFDGTHGKYPDGGLVMHGSSNSMLFGTTTEGGNGYGVVYIYHLDDNTFEVKVSLSDTDCSTPRGALMPAGGMLLGVAQSGGEFGHGAIFRVYFSGSDALFLTHSFDGSDGSTPLSGLSQVPNNNLLVGTTSAGGGVGHLGTVYSFGPFSNVFEVLHKFSTDGSTNPTGNISVFEGRLWGMTSAGGSNSKGALFSLRPKGPDHDFQELPLSVNDGADHFHGGVAFVGTPPFVSSNSAEILEDSPNPLYLYNFITDVQGGLTFNLVNNSNPELLQPWIDGDYLYGGSLENQFGSAELEIEAIDDSDGSSVVGALQVNILPVPDQPSITGAFAYVGQFNEDGLVVTRNEVDGDECTHFQVTEIHGGELYYNDEVTQISIGDFVPYSEGGLGLKFIPSPDTYPYFYIRGALGASEAFLSGSVSGNINSDRQHATITWEPPGQIYYGTALSVDQLNATSDLPGTFAYDPPLGEILAPGDYYLNMTFTPDDPGLYYEETVQRYLNVIKQTPVITWSDPQNILYGTPLSEVQLNATVDVDGDLVYSYDLGTILEPGTHELTVYLDNYDTEHYASPGTVIVNITVDYLTPVGTWEDPAPIEYGTSLSGVLNASFDVDGYAQYSHYDWYILAVGTHTITVTFYPYDYHYSIVSLSVDLTVEKATPEISWEPADLTYGNELWYDQLNVWSSVGGEYFYSPSWGEILDAGTQTLTVDFIPYDESNYNSVLGLTRTITVEKATPYVSWDNISIQYGTPLSEYHLNAWSFTPGAFFYHETPGVVFEPGEYTLTADFTPTDVGNYEIVTGITMTLTVERLTPYIMWYPAEITYGTPLGDDHLNAYAEVDGTFSYQPGAGLVLDAGMQSLSVDFFPTDGAHYQATSATIYIEVAKADQSITEFASLPSNLTFGDQPIDLSAVASSGLAVEFASSDENVISVSGAIATIVGAGTATLTVSQPGDNNYNESDFLHQIITVAKADQAITFASLDEKALDDVPFSLIATSTSGLTVGFASSDETVVSITGDLATITGAGAAVITASQPGDGNYNPAPTVEGMLVVAKRSQVITFGALDSKEFGDAPFLLDATSTSGLAATFASSDESVISVTGSLATIVGAGTATITALQSGDNSYSAALPVEQAIIVSKANQGFTYGTLGNKVFGDAPFSLSATAGSGLEVAFSSSDENVITVTGTVATIVGAGTVTLTASQAGDDNYNAASISQTITVAKGSQVVTFAALANEVFGDAPFSLSATSTSGLAVVFESSDQNVISITGSLATIVGAGTATVSASQSGNDNYEAALSVDRTITVAKHSQVITFAALANKGFGDVPFSLSATSTSGLAVEFASSNQSVISITGSLATIVGAGTATVTASQPGNANYASALSVERTITVGKLSQAITFEALGDKAFGDEPFSLSATSTSDLTVEFSTTSDKATISGSVITIVAAGRVSVTAEQPGNINFLAATAVERSFCIVPATPVITANNANPDAPVITSSSSSGNQWFLNGTALPGATGQSHTVSAAGEYKVQVSVDDCTSQQSAGVTYMVTGALRESAEISMRVYPNPAVVEIHVLWRSHETEPRIVALYDLLGREMEKRTMDADELSMDIRGLARGTYLILGSQGSTRLQQRFVKD